MAGRGPAVVDALRMLLRIRRFEEAVVALTEQQPGLIRGHVHVGIGQEATAVAACAALDSNDYVFTTHRNHAHVLARGGDPARVLAEILGRQHGYCGGRAGSFHVAAPALGILHTSAIVGGCLPLAAGAAFAAQRLANGRLALAFFGDGAMEEGVFSETLNIAQLWRLPLVLCMENNSVSVAERPGRGSPTSEHAAKALSDVPRAYGLATETVDGTDMEAVAALAAQAVAYARAGHGPFFIEARTTRWPGNYGSAPSLRASGGPTDLAWAWAPAEAPPAVRAWVESSDPLLLHARRLLDRGTIDRAALQRLDAEVQAEIEQAREVALASPEPEPASVRHLATNG